MDTNQQGGAGGGWHKEKDAREERLQARGTAGRHGGPRP